MMRQPRNVLPHSNSMGRSLYSKSILLLVHQSILSCTLCFPSCTSNSRCSPFFISPITFSSRTILYARNRSVYPESRFILIILLFHPANVPLHARPFLMASSWKRMLGFFIILYAKTAEPTTTAFTAIMNIATICFI